ncbi:MAG: DNA translocase FtsK 4TM domain-containing protein [Candidatus Edwardsbacteria bacterium]|nr:DNA translocase FtsK 4TM domain-containing protein [Candidatus Edwardsbacteria bacterium]
MGAVKEKKETSRSREIFGLCVLLLSLFLLLGLVSFSGGDSHQWSQDHARANWAGPAGDMLSFTVAQLSGYASFLLALALLAWGWYLVRHKPLGRLFWNTLLGFGFVSILLAVAGRLHVPYYTGDLSGSGQWGAFLAGAAEGTFGPAGSWIIIAGLFVILLLIGTEINFQQWLNALVFPVKKGIERTRQLAAKKPAENENDPSAPLRVKNEKAEPTPVTPKPKVEDKPKPKETKPWSETKEPAKPARARGISAEYQKRYLGLLSDDKDRAETSEDDQSQTLVEKLKEFGVEGEITDSYTGPVITRYELKPAPGVKVNQIANLSDDLALAMQAEQIRILAPIPGKGVIGIEVPNRHRKMVVLKDLLLSDSFKSQNGPLAFALGRTITGTPFSTDLSEMPHLLIAGATGSGKSVCLNTIITSLLYHATPEDLHFIMIDPKRIELSVYRGIPHLQFQYRSEPRDGSVPREGDDPQKAVRTIEGVVTDAGEVLQVFRLAVSEMESRYKLLAKEGCRNIEEYNQRSNQMMSYLCIVIDELADLMLSREAGEIENRIAKLAQLSRAVGIHLILATQRPSVDVITGVIKANFPARLAFQVASKTDSRTILDANGADKLLGRGDMLYLPPGRAEPERLHGPFISTGETQRIVAFIREWYGAAENGASGEEPFDERPAADYSMEVSVPADGDGGGDGQDELFAKASGLVIRHQQGSVSLLQRRLKIGYSRAARLIDQLEAAGVVGPFDGSKARQVLIKNEEEQR